MADLLRIGLSALTAQQRAMAVASNNIANASTPGYSRQRLELSERAAERIGSDYVGTGVVAGVTRRITDDVVAAQLRTASAGFARTEAFVGFAEALDNLLADEQTGLNVTLQSFANAVQDVADDPSSTSARQVLISEARNLLSRFDTMDQRLDEIAGETRGRLTAAVSEINALGAGIADINRQIVAAGVSPGRPPPSDLLDQRDRLLERLSELVKVDVAEQTDGTASVFIGSGQVLVIGTDASELAVTRGNFDPAQPQIVLTSATGTVDVTQFLTGGELGGALDFNREMLSPARTGLGRIAVGLVETFNAAHRQGMTLNGQLGGDFFTLAAPQTFPALSNTGSGTVAVTVADVAALAPTSYRLTYDGSSYSLLRADDGTAVAMTGSGTAADPFVADGLEIVVGGAAAAGDQFALQPRDYAAGAIGLLVTNPAQVAAAAPTRTRAELANAGDATISAGSVVDATNPSLLATATIEFLTPSTYSIDGAGSFAYTSGGDIVVNGTRVQITGTPAAGDRFVIESNAGGVGDNRNALQIIERLRAGIFDGGSVSLQAAVGQLVTDVGAQTVENQNRRDAQKLLIDQTRQRLDSVRGVNLDEEAADLLRFEQLYQAAAQTMAVADSLFNTLLMALRR
jgi:flagellar hook-associated protein 1 FlgK